MGRVRVTVFILVGLLLVSAGCAKAREKVEAMKPTVEVQDVKLRNLTLTTATVDFSISIDNPNPIGVTITKLSYDTYYNKEGKWVFLGKGERGETQIKAKGITTVDIPYTIETREAIIALVKFLRNSRQIDIRVSGTVSIKAGPTSFSIPFSRTQRVKYELPIPTLPALPGLPGR